MVLGLSLYSVSFTVTVLTTEPPEPEELVVAAVDSDSALEPLEPPQPLEATASTTTTAPSAEIRIRFIGRSYAVSRRLVFGRRLFCNSRTETKATQRKKTTPPARVAAPFPHAENRTVAAKKTGRVSKLGSQESRHAALRRKAKARMSGESNNAAAVTPDSSLCACECHEWLSQAVSMPRQSSRKMPSKKTPRPATMTAREPTRPSKSGLRVHQRPSPTPMTSRPVRFEPTWL